MKMRCFLLALVAACYPAVAQNYIATVTGKIEAASGVLDQAAPLKVGDSITATFLFGSATSGYNSDNNVLGGARVQHATFRVGDYTWTTDNDFLDGLASPFGAGKEPLEGFYSVMDAPDGADLWVKEFTFEIGDYGYDPYDGPSFFGSFDRSSLKLWSIGAPVQVPVPSAVPEAGAWAMMIIGLGILGSAIRRLRRGHGQGGGALSWRRA